MKYTEKAPYQAPGMGDLDLLLERAVLTTSDVWSPKDHEANENEGVSWSGSYVVPE